MIARLRGRVDTLLAGTTGSGTGSAIIDVGGVGYLVACSARTLHRLQPGEAAVLEIETVLREDSLSLYGFTDAQEKEWFRLLQTVQGVGARVALSILSVLPPDALAQAIAAGDKAAVSRADGVGPKLATRLVTELKDKVGAITLGPAARLSAASSSGSGASDAPGKTGDKKGGAKAKAADSALRPPVEDAVSALVNLGYGRSEAFGAVARAIQDLGEAAGLNDLIRAGLKGLAREVTR